MSATGVRANAKVNLWLRIEGRRMDGFHDIETVFQSVGLADELEFAGVPRDVSVEMVYDGLSAEQAPSPDDNLVARAAAALRASADGDPGARVKVTKRIPIGGGLGGGSADAAATLVSLNDLWNVGLSQTELMELASTIGSDTAFCIAGGAAIGEGRGERLTLLDDHPPLALVLGLSRSPLLTGDVYARAEAMPGGGGEVNEMVDALESGDAEAVAALLRNDLEPAAFSLRPELEAKKAELVAAGALGALVSGSGPTVFGLCFDLEDAYLVERRCRDAGIFDRVEVAETRPSCVEYP
ncbi:MAG: 4-diphosphocytidyl-2-C-methyl-D-erythritol kinase [Actinomycetota bacterium]|nr:4-diphosphocytidyl-2-C-methyl-D-erythritol kinase [Actinomycetota bacterium]